MTDELRLPGTDLPHTGVPVLIVGATGSTGSSVMEFCTYDNRFSRIYAPSRRTLRSHHGLVNPVHKDIATALGSLEGRADVMIFCFGSTRAAAGGADAFAELELRVADASLAAAKRLGVKSAHVVSSLGANASASNGYLRVKGEIEARFEAAAFESLYIYRPSTLRRRKPRPAERVGIAATMLLWPVKPLAMGIWPLESRALARVIVSIASAPEPGVHVVDNALLHKSARARQHLM